MGTEKFRAVLKLIQGTERSFPFDRGANLVVVGEARLEICEPGGMGGPVRLGLNNGAKFGREPVGHGTRSVGSRFPHDLRRGGRVKLEHGRDGDGLIG